MHFSDESPDSVGKSKRYSILKVSETAGNENVPKTDGCGDNSGEANEGKGRQELYKFRVDCYRARYEHTSHAVTTEISYESQVSNSINGHLVGRDSPLILIDIG